METNTQHLPYLLNSFLYIFFVFLTPLMKLYTLQISKEKKLSFSSQPHREEDKKTEPIVWAPLYDNFLIQDKCKKKHFFLTRKHPLSVVI